MSNMGTKQKHNTDVFTNELSREVYETKYKYGNETIDTSRLRVASAVANIEEDKKKWTERFQWLLEDFKFIPGGRILSNAGIPVRGTTLLNCYVSGFQGEDQDSMDSILDELRRQAMILKSEGGYGFCVDALRPKYSFISGIGSESPGAVKMLDMWDTQSDVITSGSGKKSKNVKAKSGIRKGAQMVTMSCWHPDIEEFITAKQTEGRLTKFNMSVLVTDAFMSAVKNHEQWNLEFPDFDEEQMKPVYRKNWDGNIVKWKEDGYPVKVFKTFADANELWDLIVGSTYKRNEPGILFIDRINYWNNLYWLENISSTNPCVAEGTLVNTPYGYKKVENIKVGDLACTVLGSEPVDNIEIHDAVDLYRVTFSDGGEEIVTGAHQYHAKRTGDNTKYYEPTRLDELNIGDIIRIETTALQSHDTFNTHQYNMGVRAGIILGDGCYTDNTAQIKIAVNTSETEYNKMIKDVFGNDSFIKDSPGEGLSGYFIFKKDAVDPLLFGVKPGLAHEKSIDYDFANNIEYITGVLDGLLATDGTVNLKSNHPSIRFNTTSKQLAQDIRRLLLYLGCYSTISKSFDESGTINGREIHRRHIKYTVNVSGASFKKYYSHTKLGELHAEKYNKIKTAVIQCSLNGNYGNTAIRDIEYVGKGKVYDLYCKESDTWITSGYVQRGCGEQPLPIGGACLLGNLNLTQFVLPDGNGWDYAKIKEVIPVAVRFMDNVNDITYVPLDIQKKNIADKRRIGLGIMGYASALTMMKVRYGSDEALKITGELMDFIMNAAYSCSALLAAEKGTFPLYDRDKYLKGKFVANLNNKTKELIRANGMRNSHMLSIAPTGNTSSLANVVSGGLEPIFRPQYVRTMIVANWPDNVDRILSVDWENKTIELEGTKTAFYAPGGSWAWIKEGDEHLLRGIFIEPNEVVGVYKYDKNRGLTRENIVTDYGVAWLQAQDEYDPGADYAVDTNTLNIDDHLRTMTTIAKFVDSSMSKTINIAKDYDYEDFKKVYEKAYDSGVIKGCTTYRDGTMTTVLSDVGESSEQSAQSQPRIVRTKAPKRPKTLECDIHHLTIGGDRWLVFIGLYGDARDPYEVFAFKRNGIQISTKVTTGRLVKAKLRNHQTRYDLDLGEIVIEDICSHFKTGEESALTRMISTSLRHGADMDYIYDQLMKAEGSVVSFSKAVARAIKKYVKTIHDKTCPSCGAENALTMEEGCMRCTVCPYTACG